MGRLPRLNHGLGRRHPVLDDRLKGQRAAAQRLAHEGLRLAVWCEVYLVWKCLRQGRRGRRTIGTTRRGP